jgi:hypothetical protein
MRVVKVARALVLISGALFGLIGVGYLVAPGFMLSIVGIPSAPTVDFLMRTEGVALLTAGSLLFAAGNAGLAHVRFALLVLGGYYVLGSVVDLAAFGQGIVGLAAVPSAIVRVLVGGICLLAAARARDEAVVERA